MPRKYALTLLIISLVAIAVVSFFLFRDPKVPTVITSDTPSDSDSVLVAEPLAKRPNLDMPEGQLPADTDSIAHDTIIATQCYRWDREFRASTQALDEDGKPFEYNIFINLQPSISDLYQGEMTLCADNYEILTVLVEGHAEGNHITMYYVEELDTETNVFAPNDKLVKVELVDGNYEASWYRPMHNFVDGNTIFSIR